MARDKSKLVFIVGAETKDALDALGGLDKALDEVKKGVGQGQASLDEYGNAAEETAKKARAAFRQLRVRRDDSLEGEIKAIEERKQAALQAENLTQNERLKIEAGANRRIEKLRGQLNIRLKSDQEKAIDALGVVRERDVREQIKQQEEIRDKALENSDLTANDRIRIEEETTRRIEKLREKLATDERSEEAKALKEIGVLREREIHKQIRAQEELRRKALASEGLTANDRLRIERETTDKIEKLRKKLIVEVQTEEQKALEEQEAAIKEIGVLREKDIRDQIRDQERLRDQALQNTELTANDRLRIERETARKIKRLNRDLADAAASDFKRRMREASASLRGAGEGLTNAGGTVSTRVSAPVGIGLGFAIREAAKLEENLNAVRAVSANLTNDEFEALRRKARELGSSTKFTAAEVAGAIETLTKNGVSAQDILSGAIDGTIKTAAASGSDIRLIADLMTDIQLQFGLTAEELKDVGDVVQGTAQSSKFAAEDLAYAFSQGGLVASKAGLSMREYAAAIAATAEGFSSGSDAGTAFKTFVNGLTNGTKAAVEHMDDYGLSFTDAEGNFRSLSEIAETLHENLADLPNATRNNVLKDIFGTDALRTAQLLTEKGADGINDALSRIAEGDAAKAAEIRMEGLVGELAKLRSASAELGIALAESGLIQALTDLVVKFTEIVTALGESNPGLMKFVAWAGVALAVLGPLLMAVGQIAIGLAILAKAATLFGGLGRALGILKGPLKFFWNIIKLLFGGFRSVLGVLLRLGIAIASFVAAVTGLPVAIVAAIAAAVAAVGALVWTFREEIITALSGAWDFVADHARQAFTALFAWFVDKFRKLWELIPSREDVASAWEGSTLRKMVNSIPGFATGVINLAGPGTGTSDSIPAMLSQGESVITARATRFWGADFMQGIQNMDLSRVMMPVPAPVPFATAGGQGGDIVHMHFGRGSDYELQAAPGVIDQMRRDQNVKRLLSPANPTRNKR